MASIRDEEGLFIVQAFEFLEHPSFLLRVANAVGKPLEVALDSLSPKHKNLISRTSELALRKGLTVVSQTLSKEGKARTFSQSEKNGRRKGQWHALAAFGVGAAGGFFGMLSLPVELPVTVSIMLRSIAAIADEFGMDLRDPSVQLECLYILSLGSPHHTSDDAMKSAYWTSRAVFAKAVSEAVASPSILVKFISAVAARFEIVVGEKLLAEALPVIGAIGGGLINAAFTDYFSETARYHFGLRALEKRYGREAIEEYYTTNTRMT